MSKQNARENKSVISFGKGVRLMSEEYYIRELSPFGISQARAFRALCRSICCPIIVFGRTAFVDPAVFQVCIKHLSLPGNLDFLGPNSSIKKDRKTRPRLRTKVDPKEVQENWSHVIRAILDSRRLVGLHTPETEKAAIRSAAAELTRFVLTMIPSAEQTNGGTHRVSGESHTEGDQQHLANDDSLA